MIFPTTWQRVRHDERGATIIEFAFVAPIFFFLTMCLLELGLMQFTQIAIESATMAVSRSSSICDKSMDCADVIRDDIKKRTRGLINAKNIIIQSNVLSKGLASGGVPAVPDYCLVDGEPVLPSGADADGHCICPASSDGRVHTQDNNGNGVCDAPTGVNAGNGGNIVEIRVTYPWKLLIPFLDRVSFIGTKNTTKLLGENGVVMLSATTVIKNEPE